MHLSTVLGSLLVGLATVSSTYAQNATSYGPLGTTPAQRYELSQEQAQQILSAAAAKAASLNARENIAVVTPNGYLLAFARGDNAPLASIEVAIKKARTVALFNGARTTEDLGPLIQPGGAIYGIDHTNGGLIGFPGGLPVYMNGVFVGAVGVGGGSGAQDVEVATAGIEAVGKTTQT